VRTTNVENLGEDENRRGERARGRLIINPEKRFFARMNASKSRRPSVATAFGL
jgi:hypothetical protein